MCFNCDWLSWGSWGRPRPRPLSDGLIIVVLDHQVVCLRKKKPKELRRKIRELLFGEPQGRGR